MNVNCPWWVYDYLLFIAQLASKLSQRFVTGKSNVNWYRNNVSRYRNIAAFLLNKLAKRLAGYAKHGLLGSAEAIVDGLPEIPCEASKPISHVSRVGVRVVGFAGRQFGLGVSARNYLEALMAAGIPVEYVEPDIEIPHSSSDYTSRRLVPPGQVAATLFFVGPEFFDLALSAIPEKKGGELWIGCWFWELENIPSKWHDAIQKVDALMVSSGFVADAFSKQTSKPIIKVPVPIDVPENVDNLIFTRPPSTKFCFLVVFDFYSSIHRKNPFGAIHAFMRAFPRGDEPVSLLIKTSNCVDFPEDFRALVRLAHSDARITIIDAVLSSPKQRGLIASADALISLHRSEGFGLVLAESMALGKVVIATGWSGNTEFMSRANACLIDYSLVPVEGHQYPHALGARWAEPDLDQSANLMRNLAEGRFDSTNLVIAAQLSVASQLNPAKIANDLILAIDRLRH